MKSFLLPLKLKPYKNNKFYYQNNNLFISKKKARKNAPSFFSH